MTARIIKSDVRAKAQRIVAGRVDVSAGSPSIAQGQGFTIADTAAGKVTITFSKPGHQLVSMIATPIENTDATGYSCKIMGTPSGSSAVVGVYVADATDGALADNISFFFQAVLQDQP
jgi:hypothetical protein